MQFHDITVGIFAFLAVLGLIWLIQRGVRAGGLARPDSTGRLRIVQSLVLDPKRRVLLLRCDGNDLVLLVGGANDLLLSVSPAAVDMS